jgi:hypothetical protein
MARKFLPGRSCVVFFLSFCFLVALSSSGYYELCEVDIFLPGPCYENPDLATLNSTEKIKSHLSLSSTFYFSGYYSGRLLSAIGFIMQAASPLFKASPDDQINIPRRC